MRILMPQNCLLCNAEAGPAILCPDCLADLPIQAIPACPICAQPTTSGESCGSCLRRPPAFKRTLVAYQYAFPLDQLVHALKYQHQFAVIDTLTAPLIAALRAVPLPDAVIAMPLHPLRLRERGFNQSLLLARYISHQLQLPLLTAACTRTRNTAAQTTLSIQQRQKNLRGAFACGAAVANRRIAIIDDVMTSGSSLESLAAALLNAGAGEVECWVVARAVLS